MLLRSMVPRTSNRSILSLSRRLYSTPPTEPFKKKVYSRIPLNSEPLAKPSEKFKKSGPDFEFATWKGLVLTGTVGLGVYLYFKYEKKRIQTSKEADSNRGVNKNTGYGKPLIGGPFQLVDTNNNTFTHKDLEGKWSLVYFGFTHCPDICPEELDQLGEWLKMLDSKGYKDIQSVFITCDPNRDTPEVIKDYLLEFHDGIVGLTGTHEQIKHVCKQYRVYFSTPKDVPKGQDYLVDHSIFFYLMDPQGEFVQALGRQYDGPAGVAKIIDHIDAYNEEVKSGDLLAAKNKRWFDKSALEK
ncbi:Cu-binding protein [Hanseniaspora uvarum]|nr:Cu-binding protein [Hanseniaspora uvarum]